MLPSVVLIVLPTPSVKEVAPAPAVAMCDGWMSRILDPPNSWTVIHATSIRFWMPIFQVSVPFGSMLANRASVTESTGSHQ